MQNFGDFAKFSVHFCILYAECPPYFYFQFVWPTDLESISHAPTPTAIIPTKFEVVMTIQCQDIAFCLLIHYVTLTSDRKQLSYMAGHVTKPAIKFEEPMPIRSWFMSYNISHLLPLKMCMRPLRICRNTWPVTMRPKTMIFLESLTPIYLSLYNFYEASTKIKGRLLWSRVILKPFPRKKFLQSKWGDWNPVDIRFM